MLRSLVRQVVARLRRHSLLILAALVLSAMFVVPWRFSVWPLAALAMRQPYLQALLAGVLSFGLLVLMLWKVPKRQASGVQDIKDRLTVENAARQTLAQIIGGAVLIAGLFFTWANLNVAQKNIKITQDTATKSQETATKNQEIAREGQITDRFTKAIAQLGEHEPEKLAVRLGGIYALARIAKDSKDDHWPIMEVLTAYVREKAPWPPPVERIDPPRWLRKPATDIQAILTVLGRRAKPYGAGEYAPLDLTSTDLRWADLRDAHLEGAILFHTHFEGANLRGAHLEGAKLFGTQLKGADLHGAYLEGAVLIMAYLEGVKNLTVGQLLTVKTLFGTHLDPSFLEQIQQLSPQLRELPAE